MARKGRKRLAIDIPVAVHEALKAIAAKRNCTITRYVLRGIIMQLKQEER